MMGPLSLRQPDRIVVSQGRLIRCLEYFFLFVGLIALDYYIWANLDSMFYQAYESWSFDRQVKGLPVSITAFLKNELGLAPKESEAFGVADRDSAEPSSSNALPGDANPDLSNRQTSANAGPLPKRAGINARQPLTVIGRIQVPRLQLSAMVREGVGDETLRRAVGHIPSTALPGQIGNTALAGHRDTFFRKLRDIRKKDKIVVSTLDGTYDYLVESVKVVTPQDVSVLKAVPGEQVLTLVTCFPFNYIGAAPKRFIVRAKQVEPPSGKAG